MFHFFRASNRSQNIFLFYLLRPQSPTAHTSVSPTQREVFVTRSIFLPLQMINFAFEVVNQLLPFLRLHSAADGNLCFGATTMEAFVLLLLATAFLNHHIFPLEVLEGLVEPYPFGVQLKEELFGVLGLDGGGELVGEEIFHFWFPGQLIIVEGFFLLWLSHQAFEFVDLHAFLLEFGQGLHIQVLLEDSLDPNALCVGFGLGTPEEGHSAEAQLFAALVGAVIDILLALQHFPAFLVDGGHAAFLGSLLLEAGMGRQLAGGLDFPLDVTARQHLVDLFVDLHSQNRVVEDNAEFALEVGVDQDVFEVLLYEQHGDLDVNDHEELEHVDSAEE